MPRAIGTRLAITGSMAARCGTHARSLAALVEFNKDKLMRKLFGAAVAGVILAGGSLALVGCTDETGSKTETQVKGPGGTTTVIDKTTVEKSGQNPPTVPTNPRNP
jgi:hypothetical protein